MNIANLIALFRIVCLPVIIYLIYQETATASSIAVFLFALAIISDIVDGYVARKRNEVTKAGSFLDLFADKTLTLILMFIFVLTEAFSVWLLLIFVVREIVAIFVRWFATRDSILVGEKVYSKLVVASQFGVVLGLLIENFLIMDNVVDGMFLVYTEIFIVLMTIFAVIVSVVSVFHYLFAYHFGLRKRKKVGRKVENENMVVLANKRARGYHSKYRRRLLKKFSKRRKAPLIFLSHNKKDMFIGAATKTKNFDHVVIAGGDGSFEGALNYKPFHEKVLGFFPLGAGNAYYSYFYKGNRFEYLRSRFNFMEIDLDILELEWEGGKTQSTFITLGIDSDVARYSKERTKSGFSDYIKASYKALLRAKSDYDFSCKLDGKKRELNNCPNLTICKVPYYGYGVRSITGNLDSDDNYVYASAVINTHNVFLNKAVRFWGLILGMLNKDKNPLLKLKAKKFIIESEVPFPIQAGGEFLGHTKWVKVRVVRKQKVLVI
ncbi:hypothetical protein HOE37_01665 [Candidatus Woesearchaeota archaeon]|jgi:CDP-diacylglycerol---glycerol-3-phosphate 3-phosphatidyltransferase|nr:hypothetical protein [Candidatus Woesearchaeota archaeon]MBT4110542.1 hypothetical protein [Candidatus Woesearchaeota archaeon]MBT4335934.1 hypothetical protein [Candidatus Woesearchaeota archaeon]MBT4469087.1 hypothetical protein [Candidatus Woesearchaeota archaeon]MBT6744594.1 hypothetical protein [Candidatus Woesearchaeota archaeon]